MTIRRLHGQFCELQNQLYKHNQRLQVRNSFHRTRIFSLHWLNRLVASCTNGQRCSRHAKTQQSRAWQGDDLIQLGKPREIESGTPSAHFGDRYVRIATVCSPSRDKGLVLNFDPVDPRSISYSCPSSCRQRSSCQGTRQATASSLVVIDMLSFRAALFL